MVIGGFDLGDFDNSGVYPLVLILFTACTLFNMIVLLNLLIAIISETFATVNTNAETTAQQEMTKLIAENNFLVPNWAKEAYAERNPYLLVITDLEAEEDIDGKDPLKISLKRNRVELEGYIDDSMDKLVNRLTESFDSRANPGLRFGENMSASGEKLESKKAPSKIDKESW